MALPSPPPAPQRGDRTTFSSRVDAFLFWLVGLIPLLNTFLSSLTTAAGGGANTFAYTFDTATADADPGTGKLRLGSATQNGSVVMRLDSTAGNGGGIDGFLTAFGAGTSNVKGSVRLQRLNDVGAWLLFDITAAVLASGYWNLTLTPRTGSAESPFAENDTLLVFFGKHGDKGDSGGTPTAQQIRDAVGTLGIVNGGTGATTAAQARTNLGAKASGTEPISTGGTGATTSAQALANLGGLPLVGGTLSGPIGFRPLSLASTVVLWEFAQPNGNKRVQLVSATDGTPYFYTYDGGANYTGSIGITSGGFVASGTISAAVLTQSSDERKKENWRLLTDEQLDALADMTLAGIFDWTAGGSSAGGSAQQIRAIVPEVVHENPETGELSVDYGGLNFAISQAHLRRAKRERLQ